MQENEEVVSRNNNTVSKRKKMKMWFNRKLKVKDASWRYKLNIFKWKRLNLNMSFLDTLVFKIMSVFEAIVLVGTLSFFFLCCGCHF
ncbi:hypothetical protein M5689_009120 [Euphorbia peplus]|nr:hypothetical protein M5689_009120 [Euphorbia peplus]